jgi:cytosine/adenosine deaminase-related metal-dependent hydrolase
MRYLSANWIYPLHIPPINEGVIQLSDKGEVVNLFNSRREVPSYKLEIFDGVLCPGFVNAHCHLELSHLLGIAEKGNGFLEFAGTIRKRDDFSEIEKQNEIEKAEQQMIDNGIVAVGDICNTSDTLLQKQKENLKYYNFIETFGVDENKVNTIFAQSMELRNKFRNAGQKATIVPHAPYSVPPSLMRKISNAFDNKDLLLSIHMQETKEENQLFENKDGIFLDWLIGMNANKEIWEKRKNSTYVLKELGRKKILLVHNTFIQKEDVTDNYYCTCPKANLYIEKMLPDYSIFDTDKLCVGTDSLASNNTLSILDELLVIQENSNFDMNTLLKIACKNGAEALGFEKLGTFEQGKKPGLNLIYNSNKVYTL